MQGKQKRGTTGTSYGLVVGLIAIVALGATTSIGTNVTSLFDEVAGDMDQVVSGGPAPAPSASASASPSPSPMSCVSHLGHIWCQEATNHSCDNNGPVSLGDVCTNAGYSWAGDFTLSDADAYSVAIELRIAEGVTGGTANDGCGSGGEGNNTFTMDNVSVFGICSRETRVQQATDKPCAPWASHNGTDWRVFSRCQ